MGRPSTIRDETIVDAARAVFLARGIRATAAEVAERAGVSEGSIFNRFKTKLELFAAAMRSQIDEPAWARTLESGVGRGDVRDVLIEAAHEVLAFNRTILPLMMMSWSNPALEGIPCGMPGASASGPQRSLRRVASFFEAEAAAGRIANADPEVLARVFLGALHSFVLLELLEAPAQGALTADAFVREHVRLLWEGIAPRRSVARAGRKRRAPAREPRPNEAKA